MAEVFDKVTITTEDLGSGPAPAVEAVPEAAAPADSGGLETALAEFEGIVHLIEEAGFVVSSLEAAMGAPARLIPHFRMVHDAGEAAQQRLLERHADKPLAGVVLETLMQAQALVRKTQPEKLQFAEVIVELATPPQARVVWREEVVVKTGAAKAMRAKVAVKKPTPTGTKPAAQKPVTARVVGPAPSKAVPAVPVGTAKKSKPAGK